jgi:hypothetical protein
LGKILDFFERISPKNFARKKHSGPEQLQSERPYNFGQSHPHQQLGRGMPPIKKFHLILALAPHPLCHGPLSPSLAPIPLSLLSLFVRGYIDEQF